jgi:hypothetical protein
MPGGPYLPFYIPGVGTKFPEIGDEGGMLGSAIAWDGEARIIWALTRLLNAPHAYVLKRDLIPAGLAKTISNTLGGFGSTGLQRRVALRTWQDKLAAALKDQKPRIEQINLSVFGFSRGAAEARAFCNWLFEACEPKGGGWEFAGIPLRLQFLGIFDTVASVGLTDLYANGIFEGHQGWADNNMEIHPAIEQCVHYVAGHEVRACFPLDSVRVRKSYPANAKEVMYPGVHSDVGGGYAPNAVGVSPTPADMIAIIPGVNMYREALNAGVPLLGWDELGPLRQAGFTPSAPAIDAFNGYVKDAAIGAGPVEVMHRKHMSLFFSYRFKYRATFKERPFYKRASAKDRRYLSVTERTLIERLSSLRHPTPVLAQDYDPKAAAMLQRQMFKAAGLDAQDKNDIAAQYLYQVIDSIDVAKLTPDIERLFDDCLHDSMASFLDMGVNEYDGKEANSVIQNGIGIMKFRKIFVENG